MAKVLMKGNEALAEAAVRAGCRFFAGYPITPQTEVLEYLCRRLPEAGGVFVQTESELAGISMAYGAAAAGFRAMTSSSGPGFSLLQEGISYLASAELPCVIVDVMRYGSGLGDIFTAQGDYWQAVKNGGHGDYRCLVYAPASVQESADLTGLAFAKAEEHRNPVLLLTDASIAQMMEPVELPEPVEHDPDRAAWSLKGKGGGPFRRITSTMYYRKDHDAYVKAKYGAMERSEQRWEAVSVDDAEVVLVAYGISSRICREAVREGRKRGLRIGLIRPITLFPFPVKAFEGLSRVRAFLSVELTPLAQMREDVVLAAGHRAPVRSFTGGLDIPEPADVLEAAEKALQGREPEACGR
jgi:2-oxoglutarate ferredoxin oxidoreductase subunit alpha